MTIRLRTSWFFSAAFFFFFALFALSDTAFAFDEYTRVGQAETTGSIEEFRLTSPTNLAGLLNLEVGEDDICSVDFECWAKAKNRKMAQEFTELVEVNLEKIDEVVTLQLATPRNAPWEGTNYAVKVTLDIYVPPDIVVETKTSAFEIDISGPLKKTYIKNRYGSIELSDVSEETRVTGSYNRVELADLQGELEVETSYNSISAEDVNTKGKRAFVKTSYGNIELDNFSGQLEAYTVYSPIYASNITLLGGRNEIKTVYSKVELELEALEEAKLYVYNSYGNVDLAVPTDLSARLTLTVGRGGKINTERILIKPQVLEKTRLEGICGDGDSEIEVDISGIGKIRLEGR